MLSIILNTNSGSEDYESCSCNDDKLKGKMIGLLRLEIEEQSYLARANRLESFEENPSHLLCADVLGKLIGKIVLF